MRNELLSVLKDLGLSDKEAQVYLAGLSLGACTVSDLARTSGVNRTTVYPIIESLQKKSLVTIQPQGFKRRFLVEPPEKLEVMLEVKKGLLVKNLPDFQNLYATKDTENFIEYYEGIEKIKKVYEDLLQDVRTTKDYLVIANQDTWLKLSPDYFKRFIKKRAEIAKNHGLIVKMLLQDTEHARNYRDQEREFGVTIKFLPKSTVLNTNTVITSRRLVIHNFGSPDWAVVIKHENVIATHKELFELLWSSRE